MADYKEGVDFEIRTVKTKDGKTAYKNRHFFTKAEKEAMKAPKKEAPKKAESKPAKATTTKPKAETKAKPVNAVRPEGKAAGMPAAKKPTVDNKTAAIAGAAVGASKTALAVGKGVGKASAKAAPKPATAKPVNPSYTGKAGAPSGFRGKFETGVARAGGGARVGGIPIGPRLRGKGARIVKMPDILDLQNMAKGGMVKKGK